MHLLTKKVEILHLNSLELNLPTSGFSVSQNPDVDKLVKDFNWVNENKTSYKYVIG